jgi:hypothetical protein
MLVGVWDVPDSPVAWTAQGCDQSTLVRCQVRFCDDILRFETLADHMVLTHGMIYRPEDDGAVAT